MMLTFCPVGVKELSRQCERLSAPAELYSLGVKALVQGGSAGGKAAQACFQRAVQSDPLGFEV